MKTTPLALTYAEIMGEHGRKLQYQAPNSWELAVLNSDAGIARRFGVDLDAAPRVQSMAVTPKYQNPLQVLLDAQQAFGRPTMICLQYHPLVLQIDSSQDVRVDWEGHAFTPQQVMQIQDSLRDNDHPCRVDLRGYYIYIALGRAVRYADCDAALAVYQLIATTVYAAGSTTT